MEVLRKVGKYNLNIGSLMANGLFNVTDDELLEGTDNYGVSYWFDNELKGELMKLTDDEFVEECRQLVGTHQLRF